MTAQDPVAGLVDDRGEHAYAAARPGAPFSNGTEGEAWMDQWCNHCLHDQAPPEDSGGCPLLLVALLGNTPAEWVPDRPLSLGHQYRCTAYQEAR